MSDNWDFYFCNVNDAPSSIFVDLGLRPSAPDTSRPHLIWVWVPLRNHREDGMTSGEEFPTLGAIEDTLTPVLEREFGAILAGRITGSGRREFYFYSRSAAELEEVIAKVFADYPDYMPEFGDQPDPAWSQYLGLLYPSAQQLQLMKNREVITALANAGDVLTTIRPISHFLYFANVADLEIVAGDLERGGFRRDYVADPDMNAPFPFGLHLVRDDVAEQDAVDDAVLQILAALEGRAGDYDGWESPVMK
jgi:regulator of RNase E activity RraB